VQSHDLTPASVRGQAKWQRPISDGRVRGSRTESHPCQNHAVLDVTSQRNINITLRHAHDEQLERRRRSCLVWSSLVKSSPVLGLVYHQAKVVVVISPEERPHVVLGVPCYTMTIMTVHHHVPRTLREVLPSSSESLSTSATPRSIPVTSTLSHLSCV